MSSHDFQQSAEERFVGEPILLRPRQVARILNVCPTTLYRWRQNPEVRFPDPLRVGGYVGWRRSDIERWIESRLEAQRTRHGRGRQTTARTRARIAQLRQRGKL